MTLEEVDLACRGYERREARRKEVERLTLTVLINQHRGHGPAYRPEDIYPLITDRQRELMTRDEFIKANEFFNNIEWQSKD